MLQLAEVTCPGRAAGQGLQVLLLCGKGKNLAVGMAAGVTR
jgi:hypothetical protein